MEVYFSEEDVRIAALSYFKGDSLGASVWMTKYALKDEDKFLEKTPEDSINRYVTEFNRIERKYPNPMSRDRILELMKDYKYFIPAGSPMYGLGNNSELVALSNCYVVGNTDDSYSGIMDIDESLVQIMKRRGGVGIDISHLRPRGSLTKNAAKTTTGAVSFMERFSNTTREVAQEGRRGALMITIDITHPDIKEFITVKDDLKKVTGANISIKITDAFMKAVEKDNSYMLQFDGHILGVVRAKEIWNLIITQAWKSAEPGVLFWDTIINNSPSDCYSQEGFKTVSVNPCAELPINLFGSCLLGSMNVYSFVEEPFTKESNFNWELLYNNSMDSQKLMDNLVDIEEEKINSILSKISRHPERNSGREYRLWAEILKILKSGRRTGLGQTGLADAAAALNIKYGSEEFLEFAEKVQETISKASYTSSIRMAKERGAFPIFNYDKEKEHPFINRILEGAPEEVISGYKDYGRRNIASLTIAPNGTTSLMTQTSSGIEPVFMLEYNRRRKVDKNNKSAIQDDLGDYWEEYSVLHHKYQKYIELTGNTKSSPYDGATANEIDPLVKVEMQGKLQKWIDHSISVTHNLPKDTTEETIGNIYMAAWKHGCKGATVYRDGSRDGVLVAKERKDKEAFLDSRAPKRPKSLGGEAFCTSVKGEKFTVIVGLLDSRPYEVFAYKGNGLSGKGDIIKIKKGSYKFVANGVEEIITDDLTEEQEAITRGYSFGLMHGGHVKFAVEQLSKTKGDLSSFNKAIARVLKRFVIDGETSSSICPECDHRLVYESGCEQCKHCGYSKCG